MSWSISCNQLVKIHQVSHLARLIWSGRAASGAPGSFLHGTNPALVEEVPYKQSEVFDPRNSHNYLILSMILSRYSLAKSALFRSTIIRLRILYNHLNNVNVPKSTKMQFLENHFKLLSENNYG